MKNRMNVKRITHKEMYDMCENKEERNKLKKRLSDLDFASKNNINIFSGISVSTPIPIRLLKSKISKEDEHLIYQMISHIYNKAQGEFARTVQFVAENSKHDPNVKMIVEKAKGAIKTGDRAKEILEKLWGRKTKLNKGELSVFEYFSKKEK